MARDMNDCFAGGAKVCVNLRNEGPEGVKDPLWPAGKKNRGRGLTRAWRDGGPKKNGVGSTYPLQKG